MCLFCSIVAREIPSVPVYEDENYIVIDDIHPKARVHMLLIPKKHIDSIAHLENSDGKIISWLFLLARDIGKDMNISWYKLQFNVGKEGGQEIMHVHLHFLAEGNTK
ncbi:MAG: hypothetical protein ACD_78C00448G0004 [uncultured bacterium (gcode 4)]|uniref:HIT domain-containing protein n=1 Tax=uncultured bacterium (gcode 4) TaxID=1234023 RepID=K1YA48_9BACT|nr:MAG: hypothetical protein ACD_78C00448G0004 [uncultured bacterium (gcode 4)]